MRHQHIRRKTKARPSGWRAQGRLIIRIICRCRGPIFPSTAWGWFATARLVWILAYGIFLLGNCLKCPASQPAVPYSSQVQHALEVEDWPALLKSLGADPLTNKTSRIVVVRALFETGRLPEELFSWFHCPGPDPLSTSDLRQYAGAAHVAETLLQLGQLNAAERLAFDSMEMEGENPTALRALVRIHVTRGLTNAAGIFLNRLQAYPEHRAWVSRVRAGLAINSPASGDPALSHIRANLVTRDRIAAGITPERLLRQALEANPQNRMAFEYLVTHQLLERDLLYVRQTLASSPHIRGGPLPRHYAEALVLHRSLYPGIPLGALLARVPPAILTQFQSFQQLLQNASGSHAKVQPLAWRDFGNTYWYYYFFGALHQTNGVPTIEMK